MKKGGKGGANTKTGQEYENKVDLATALGKIKGYSLKDADNDAGSLVLYEDKLVARLFRKNQFYKFLEEHQINWKDHLSKQLLPDGSLLVIIRETLFIIEVKFQQVEGSVDEKLQTCDFKRKQYTKLVHNIGLKVEYVYVLHEWFKHPKYKDTLDYIHSVNCHYRFDSIPLSWLGLPYDHKDQSIDLC